MKLKVLTLGVPRYAEWAFPEMESLNNSIKEVHNADVVVFTGGSDVDPSVYGHKKIARTWPDLKRDILEYEIYSEALRLGKPMLGICRGAQFLTACQRNGYLVQDVKGHIGAYHDIQFEDGDVMEISSTHHQMMYPFEVEGHQLLAWTKIPKSASYEFGDKVLLSLPKMREPEVVYYPNTKCFCIQGHPESMRRDEKVIGKLKDMIYIRFFNKLIDQKIAL